MNQIFTANNTSTQIKRFWRAAYFGNRTRCPRCGYFRSLWGLSDDRWQYPRYQKKFALGTESYVSHFPLSWAAMYELLYWFELDLSDYRISKRLDLPYKQVHRFFHRFRDLGK